MDNNGLAVLLNQVAEASDTYPVSRDVVLCGRVMGDDRTGVYELDPSSLTIVKENEKYRFLPMINQDPQFAQMYGKLVSQLATIKKERDRLLVALAGVRARALKPRPVAVGASIQAPGLLGTVWNKTRNKDRHIYPSRVMV